MLIIAILSLLVSLPFFQPADTSVAIKVDTSSVNSVLIIPDIKDTVEKAPPVEESVIESLKDEKVEPLVLSHLKFKDIEIDGGYAAFGRQLENQGYRLAGASSYRGTFAGVENAVITPYETFGSVWKVGVVFPPSTHWFPVKEQYNKFKNWLAWKYVAKPTSSREQLSSRFREGTGQEAWGFESGAAVYRTIYDFPDGRVVIFIAYDQASGGMKVCIDYIDRINSIIKEENDMMDL